MFAALNNDQIIFCTAGYDRTIRFWKPSTGQCFRMLQHPESVTIKIFLRLNNLYILKQKNSKNSK